MEGSLPPSGTSGYLAAEARALADTVPTGAGDERPELPDPERPRLPGRGKPLNRLELEILLANSSL